MDGTFLRITLDDIIGLVILAIICGLFLLAWLLEKWERFKKWVTSKVSSSGSGEGQG